MPKDNMNMGDIVLKNMETGEIFKFSSLKSVDLGTEILEPVAELEQSVPDGINIHITGSAIGKLKDIDVYFKEDE